MKSALLALFWSSFLSVTSFGQIFIEDFNYQADKKLTEQTSLWTLSGSTVSPFVKPGNLEYTGYPSTETTNCLFLDAGINNLKLINSFSGISTNTLYCSFLLQLRSLDNLAAGSTFFSFGTSSIDRGNIFIQRGAAENTYRVGLSKKNTPVYFNSDMNLNTTYLIVIAYSFEAGNDICRLWVNPTLDGVEPEADITEATGTDISPITRIQFIQNATSGDLYIDAVRVGTEWSAVPLPVELSSFTAEVQGDKVELSWITKTEVNNYGFEVERSYDRSYWKSIGFVNGSGNSNSEKSYQLYDDKKYSADVVYYRLKQIDTDGLYSYSDVVEVIAGELKYELYQNYPNPFNPETRITWMQESAGAAKLSIYDAAGKLVRSYVEHRNAGMQEMVFNADGMSSGIYYYELEAGEFKAGKAMILMK